MDEDKPGYVTIDENGWLVIVKSTPKNNQCSRYGRTILPGCVYCWECKQRLLDKSDEREKI